MPNGPLTIFIVKPRSWSSGKAMSRLRSWLDSKRIQPTSFKFAEDGTRAGFELSFQNERDIAAAEAFQWQSL
jgi:hypothetical protein